MSGKVTVRTRKLGTCLLYRQAALNRWTAATDKRRKRKAVRRGSVVSHLSQTPSDRKTGTFDLGILIATISHK